MWGGGGLLYQPTTEWSWMTKSENGNHWLCVESIEVLENYVYGTMVTMSVLLKLILVNDNIYYKLYYILSLFQFKYWPPNARPQDFFAESEKSLLLFFVLIYYYIDSKFISLVIWDVQTTKLILFMSKSNVGYIY